MKKRALIIGTYDTAENGWTLCKCKLSDPEQKTNYVDKLGGDGAFNFSTVLSDGIPRYKNRTLTAVLECSEGTRDDREDLINNLVNAYDGYEWHIVHPDRPDHYLVGSVHIAVGYSDLAHAQITITANCAPWFYSTRETVIDITSTDEKEQPLILRNSGRLAVVPVLTVEGRASLTYGNFSINLIEGVHEWPVLLLTPGVHDLTYSGIGKLTIVYREAVLR